MAGDAIFHRKFEDQLKGGKNILSLSTPNKKINHPGEFPPPNIRLTGPGRQLQKFIFDKTCPSHNKNDFSLANGANCRLARDTQFGPGAVDKKANEC